MQSPDILAEKERQKALYKGADSDALERLDDLLEQAAVERLILKRLNKTILETGAVKIHPENPERQQALPVSQEVARHAASLSNIKDKLEKHLGIPVDDEDDGLGDYA